MAVKTREEVIWRTVDGEALLLNTATGFYFSLNSSGSLILSLLTEGSTVEQAAKTVAATYGIPVQTASQDIEFLLDSLRQENLLE